MLYPGITVFPKPVGLWHNFLLVEVEVQQNQEDTTLPTADVRQSHLVVSSVSHWSRPTEINGPKLVAYVISIDLFCVWLMLNTTHAEAFRQVPMTSEI